MTETIDCAVIGAGAVGLAVARALALRGREVLVLEEAGAIGTGTSSRNSEVIHAGMYYPKDSLKARLCVRGNRMLRDFCSERGVDFAMTGKLIVATDEAEDRVLDGLMEKARLNGTEPLRRLTASEARALEPELSCVSALFSPATGILDSHGYMLALQAEAEAHGAQVVFNTPVTGGRGRVIETGGADPMTLSCRTVVNCAGLGAQKVSQALGLDKVPPLHLCKGNYFLLSGKRPFSRLVYPVPVGGGLGIHYTLDLAGQGRFGPDTEWVDGIDYQVDARRADVFYASIRRYWPDLPDGALRPGYAGMRPKILPQGQAAADFLIHTRREHDAEGVVALYGIESPGLTASLALAEMVAELT
ncbi:NAD(P)/FAD-dependent oxidoreductase [Telmatospirillum sp. J64-1]|uniref:NAD(P)/FAD-dependent oxidoreductase n=1 Tax=Telmatospirillum sp. J64-1 TaxID=2502183 RepID=UPI00115CA95B|nr:NAD(P)/FAD-dependent oxidoreductase [Telmatospirillum sp. J64-1]